MLSTAIHAKETMDYVIEKQDTKYFVGMPVRTSNDRFFQDAKPLWDKFYASNKPNQNLFAVYTDYETDFTKPFTYMAASEVKSLTDIPEGMTSITVPAATYAVFIAKGAFPQSMLEAWQKIWSSDIKRTYTTDFEIYPPDFNPFNPNVDPEVKIYIAIEN